MPLFASAESRFADVADFVEQNIRDFPNAHKIIRHNIEGLDSSLKSGIANALSLGSREDKSATETERRRALRALLFLLMTEANQPPGMAPQLIAKYDNCNLEQIKSAIRHNLPLFVKSPLRSSWNPANFSPVQNPPPANFRYIVWGLMNAYTGRGISYEAILGNPRVLENFFLSTSIISPQKMATYYPYGFILKVPEHNVLSTSASDQAFKNYDARTSDIGPNTKPDVIMDINDRRREVQRVAGAAGLQTPLQILDNTTGTVNGYNEIALMGTAPGGTKVEVSGIFMKVDSKGGRYVRAGQNKAFVTDDIYRKMQTTGLTIVEITDTSGANK